MSSAAWLDDVLKIAAQDHLLPLIPIATSRRLPSGSRRAHDLFRVRTARGDLAAKIYRHESNDELWALRNLPRGIAPALQLHLRGTEIAGRLAELGRYQTLAKMTGPVSGLAVFEYI